MRWKIALLISLVVHCAAVPLALHYSVEPPDLSDQSSIVTIQRFEEVASEPETSPSPAPPKIVHQVVAPSPVVPTPAPIPPEPPKEVAEIKTNAPALAKPHVEPIQIATPSPIQIASVPQPVAEPVPAVAPVEIEIQPVAPVAKISVNAAPRYRENRQPVYPPSAQRKRQEGIVILNVIVNATGIAERVDVKQGTGFSVLDKAAVEAVRTWNFDPARIDNRATASSVEIPIAFKLTN